MSRRKENENIRRRKQVRVRLRTLIRMVIVNKSWLKDVEEEKISTNLKKNIAMLLRQERKIGILTMADKSLIRMPVWKRTNEDKLKLVNLMLNLTCFAKFPPKIRARLSRVVKFNLVSPGRAIIREGGKALNVYFILTGEVEVTKKLYNPETKKKEETLLFIGGPGDCIGDVEMIVKCERIHTCKARNDVELLCVYDDDFDVILRPFMEKQWNQKTAALSSFNYFKDWKPNQIMLACKVGTLKQYEALETIYYEDKGPLDDVHFVISGQCMILQCLKLKVIRKGDEKSYTLVDMKKEPSTYLFKSAESSTKKESKGLAKFFDDEESSDSSSDDDDVPGVYRKARKSDYKKYASMCGVDIELFPKEDKGSLSHIIKDINRTSKYRSRSRLDIHGRREFESHFIDVGSLTHGAIFGLGEQLEHRVIMARTTVQCLLIPRYWLFQKPQNPGNVWQRMRFYLNSTIPSRELLFKDFLATRKWKQYKKKLISQTLDPNTVGNPTKLQDIPIICRVVEDVDDDPYSH